MGSETEDIIMEKQANHQQKIFSIGGKLILTKTRLIFQPHGFNIGGKEIVMNLSDVVGIGKTQTMFGTSKEIWVNLKGSQLERFVVWQRDEFIDAIKKQIASLQV